MNFHQLVQKNMILTVTGHDFPGAQAMLYAAGVPDREAMKSSPHVGISTVWVRDFEILWEWSILLI